MIRTKIVCTLGPVSREPDILEQLITAGLNVARLNFSHGDHGYHGETISRVRAASEKLGIPVAILADLQGPKLRLGDLGDGVDLEAGEEVLLTTEDIVGSRANGDSTYAAHLPVQYNMLPHDVQPNERILIDDGLLEVEVMDKTETDIACKVIIGGTFKSKKGINLPGTKLSVPAITEKDWEDLAYVLEQGVDWVALSFVRSALEVYQLKDFIAERWTKNERRPMVISKIEKPEALDHIDEIIQASDGIMVARGDLGIEIPPEKVPLVQKDLIRRCNSVGKPVITATQMLDSMIRNPRPTRAEASDVANAILDGSDAIMLSGETASGKYPVESVKTMNKIAREVEASLLSGRWEPPAHVNLLTDNVTDSVSHSTVATAEAVGATAIITATASGRTARGIARYRPNKPIIAVTTSKWTLRQLTLTWGVVPIFTERVYETDEIVRDCVRLASASGIVEEGDRVVITSGVANNLPGTTNLMLVEKVTGAAIRGMNKAMDH